ncbi:MAG: hypothetical protein HND44_18700 [Chloroflexi bacterium]|nr:hypothetical protein [Ardenticatenaceae bacterium]MBL1130486.1 hypothetical protein [Chloroflexota bacterium]NOG36576.1 hypothetical protein [Chloroflexota bacterium]
MAGKKKKLSRREQKRRKQQQKNQIRRRTRWEEPETPGVNWQLMEDLRPFLRRPDLEKGLTAVMELAADSDELVHEPELRSLFFLPTTAFMLFVAAMEENGLTADDYFALPEEARSEKSFEIVEHILPELLTDEFQETLLKRAETARARFRDSGNEQKLWQTSAVQLILEMKRDEKAKFYPGLIYTIAAKSIEAGPLLIVPDEEDEEPFDEEAAQQRIDNVPGLRHYLDNIMKMAQQNFIHNMLDGELMFQLFTDAEIEEAAELLEQGSGDSHDGAGDFLNRILTEPRRAEMVARLDVVLADLPEYLQGIRPFLEDIQTDLPELEPQTPSWAALIAALIGEINSYEPD